QIDYAKICERTKSAVAWFQPKVDEEILETLQAHIDAWVIKKRTKKYITDLRSILLDVRRKKEQLAHCLTIADVLTNDGDLSKIVDKLSKVDKTKDGSVKGAQDEGETKDTKAISL